MIVFVTFFDWAAVKSFFTDYFLSANGAIDSISIGADIYQVHHMVFTAFSYAIIVIFLQPSQLSFSNSSPENQVGNVSKITKC